MNKDLIEYKNWLEKRNLSPLTIRTRMWEMREYGSRELSIEEITRWIKDNLTRYQPNSLKSFCETLSSFAKFKKTEIEWELIKKIIPKVQRKFFVTIDEKELEQLKNALSKTNKLINKRNNLILDFFFYTGIRIDELVNIRHCDYQNKSLRIHGKGNKIRHIFVPKFLTKCFNGSSDFLFQTRKGNCLEHTQIRAMIFRKAKGAEIDKHLTPHTFRRSFATLLNNRKVDLTTIQKLLGHSDINTTSFYIHNNHEKLYKDYSKAINL